ncbi:MAG: FkbM family methyltransferase [Myxococcales bacterium]|nr:FkbM family methyltransferase [Myxococcales bacterium]
MATVRDVPLRFDDLNVSFAQHGEDIVLGRVFFDQPDGFWIDVGANDPVIDSVTHAFSARGWLGVNVEPLAALHQRLVEARPRDVNLKVAVSNRVGELQFEEVEGALGLSTATTQLANDYRAQGRTVLKRTVPCVTLAEICAAHCTGAPIDFMKIDVEGHEREVIEGGDFQRFRPRVLVIESGWHPEAWHEVVLSRDYVLALDDTLNRYYVRAEEASLAEKLGLPANVNDRFLRADQAMWIQLGREWDALGPIVRAFARRLAQAKDASPLLKAQLKALLRLE